MERFITTIIDGETGEIVLEKTSKRRPRLIERMTVDETREEVLDPISALREKGLIDRYGKIRVGSNNSSRLFKYMGENKAISHHIVTLVNSLSKTHNRIYLTERTYITKYKQLKEVLGIQERNYQTVCKKLKEDNVIREMNGYVYFNPVYYYSYNFLDIRTIFCFKEELDKAGLLNPKIKELLEGISEEDKRRLEQ